MSSEHLGHQQHLKRGEFVESCGECQEMLMEAESESQLPNRGPVPVPYPPPGLGGVGQSVPGYTGPRRAYGQAYGQPYGQAVPMPAAFSNTATFGQSSALPVHHRMAAMPGAAVDFKDHGEFFTPRHGIPSALSHMMPVMQTGMGSTADMGHAAAQEQQGQVMTGQASHAGHTIASLTNACSVWISRIVLWYMILLNQMCLLQVQTSMASLDSVLHEYRNLFFFRLDTFGQVARSLRAQGIYLGVDSEICLLLHPQYDHNNIDSLLLYFQTNLTSLESELHALVHSTNASGIAPGMASAQQHAHYQLLGSMIAPVLNHLGTILHDTAKDLQQFRYLLSFGSA